MLLNPARQAITGEFYGTALRFCVQALTLILWYPMKYSISSWKFGKKKFIENQIDDISNQGVLLSGKITQMAAQGRERTKNCPAHFGSVAPLGMQFPSGHGKGRSRSAARRDLPGAEGCRHRSFTRKPYAAIASEAW